MGLLGIQIISIVFIFFMLYVVQIHYRKKELPTLETIFWSTSLVVLAVVVIVPDTAQFLTRTFSVTRLMDLGVIISLMVLFAITVDSRIQIHKLRRKLEDKVRNETIKRARR